jgi:Fe-Mn family superoxide dismutase
MTFNFIKWATIAEAQQPKTLVLADLPYGRKELAPSLSEETIDYHYGKLAKTYVDRYNAGEGDADFNEAGAFLHNILFPQYQPVDGANTPDGYALSFLLMHYASFEDFKEKFEKVAMSIQGSGWVYLARNGEIKTIKNHQIKGDIVLLIDWWEHAWALDYQHDKKRYLINQWKIINWDIINARLSTIG